jgi:hypothetical protein
MPKSVLNLLAQISQVSKKIENVYYLYWTQLQFSTQPRPTSIFFPRPATPPPLPWWASATRPPDRPSWPHAGGALPTCRLVTPTFSQE